MKVFSDSFACTLLSRLALLAPARASLPSLPLFVFASFSARVVTVVSSHCRLQVQVMADLQRLFARLGSCHRCRYYCTESQRQGQSFVANNRFIVVLIVLAGKYKYWLFWQASGKLVNANEPNKPK